MNQTVFITGVTGAIGRALATKYASLNYNLVLHGRDESKLHEIASECRTSGVEVKTCVIDLTDTEQVIVETGKLLKDIVPDIFIANAGVNINLGEANLGEHLEDIATLVDVNIKSVFIMSNLMAKAMTDKASGQIVLISSLAGFFGLPITPSYSASKSAIKSYGEALRGWLAPAGVGVTVILPGYVQSAMCDNMPGPKPFLLAPDRAADIIYKAVRRNKARVSFPFPLNLGTWFLSVLPPSVSLWILKRLNYCHE